MILLIDGYNIIGIAHKDRQAKRNWLISRLIDYKAKTLHDITVVFDGWRNGFYESRDVIGGVKIIYSGYGEKADDVIFRIISNERRKRIVVTSDREIAAFAWEKDCIPISSEKFEQKLSNGHIENRTCCDNDYDDDDDDAEIKRKKQRGNPRKSSKKDALIKKALEKL
ncbi:protein of unknown function DUF901 [Candidatus Magnetoovum chiemensis]|nr:protein of unknown function DUF901 [Candidatus Magnetoovum chiemensis]